MQEVQAITESYEAKLSDERAATAKAEATLKDLDARARTAEQKTQQMESALESAEQRCRDAEKQVKAANDEAQKVTDTIAPSRHDAPAKSTNIESAWQAKSLLKQREEEKQTTQSELDDLLMVFGDLEEKVAKYKVRHCSRSIPTAPY